MTVYRIHWLVNRPSVVNLMLFWFFWSTLKTLIRLESIFISEKTNFIVLKLSTIHNSTHYKSSNSKSFYSLAIQFYKQLKWYSIVWNIILVKYFSKWLNSWMFMFAWIFFRIKWFKSSTIWIKVKCLYWMCFWNIRI